MTEVTQSFSVDIMNEGHTPAVPVQSTEGYVTVPMTPEGSMSFALFSYPADDEVT